MAALAIAPLLLGEVGVYAALSRPRTVLEHFELFHANWLAGRLTLDLLGMIADFFATTTAFSVLDLSNQYYAATTDAERATVLAAGQAMFTLFNENAFLVSYVLVSAAWTMMSAVMVRSDVFSRITGYAGVLAGAAGIVGVVLEHIPGPDARLGLAIALYLAATAFLFLWVVLVGRRLYRFGTIAALVDHLPTLI